MSDKKSSLSELKKNYAVLQKEYSLPDFKELNEVFDIEKIAGNETDHLLREIRKVITEKIMSYFRFVEGLLNPSSVGGNIFLMSLTACLKPEDRKIIEKLYSKFGNFEIEIFSIDNKYSEKVEASFIKKINAEWGKIQEDFDILVNSFKKNWNNKKTDKKDKGYFG